MGEQELPPIASSDQLATRTVDTDPEMIRLTERLHCAWPANAHPLINATDRRLRDMRSTSDMRQWYRRLLPCCDWQLEPLPDLQ
jgi:hypothetical protein